MNVLFICDEYPPGKNGGIGAMVCVLGRELVKQGHQVFVAGLYPYSYGGFDYEEDKGVKVWRFRYGLKLRDPKSLASKVYNNLPDAIKQHLNGKKAFEKYLSFIHELIKKEDVHIIEIPDWNTFALNIGFRVQWPGFRIPLSLKSHGSYSKLCHDLGKPPKPKFSKIDSLLYKRADALSAVSQDTANINRKLFNISREIKVLYNGIELPQQHSSLSKEPKKVVFTGALTVPKGIFQLIKAWNLVIEKHPDALLIVFGKGETQPLLNLLSKKAAGSVLFKGHVSRDVLFQELGTATMAVFPSYSESFSLAPLEAMAMGCPVIYTSRSSGTELISDRENGRLIDPENINAIADTIVELIGDKAQQALYALKGRETIMDKYTIAGSAREHISYYSSVIKTYHT
jgi:glycosyltransferase involved in cell wall biosynthesis